MTNHYRAGTAFEYETRHHLEADGYWTFRMAGSHTKVDIIAVKPGQVLFIQCKRDGRISPAERIEVRRVASCLPGVGIPLIAYRAMKPARVEFSELVGNGPKDRTPWHTENPALSTPRGV